jgi:hypothetical protein
MPHGQIIYSGPGLIRYGIHLLMAPHQVQLPRLIYDDFRNEHHGIEALSFLLNEGDAFPRSDSMGYDVRTGKALDLRIKDLDLARPFTAYFYPGLLASTPSTILAKVICIKNEGPIATEFSEILKRVVPFLVVSPTALYEAIGPEQS